MLFLVDTPIWSLALRRTPKDLNPREQLKRRPTRTHPRRPGATRGSGSAGTAFRYSPGKELQRLRDYLRAFDEPILAVTDYEDAAYINNQCRAQGIAGSPIDFLICAIAARRNWEIFTADQDFARYAKAFPLKLYQVN